MCQTRKYKNANTQIHKYTNTAYDEVPERPNMWYIFERRIVQGFQKLYFHVSNAQIQKCKYTNTQFDKVPERPNMWYIFEKRIFQGYQKIIYRAECFPFRDFFTFISPWKHLYIKVCRYDLSVT